MGTPDFAVASLKILQQNGHQIVAVITNVDKKGGRGKNKIIETAVKQYAVANNINVLQPKNLKAPEFIKVLKSLKADLQIVVAFRMLPEVVWNMPKHGTYNLHGSLLPQYRGAAPINWSIINGDTETGVTSFKLKHKIDTGDLLYQRKMRIYEDDTAEDLHDRMMVLAAQVVLKTADAIASGEDIKLIEQDDSKVSKAPKIFHQNCEIDFTQECKKVYDFIRGMSPYPTAWTRLNNKKLKLFKTSFILKKHKLEAGSFHSDNKSYIHISCKDGYISLKDLQLEGKKRMKVRDFLNGVNIDN